MSGSVRINLPAQPPIRCRSSEHFQNLIIYGYCTKCRRMWGLGTSAEDQKVVERVEKINKLTK